SPPYSAIYPPSITTSKRTRPLHDALPIYQAPKSFLYKMLRKKNITLNGKKALGNEILSAGDTVKLFLSDETVSKFSRSRTQETRSEEHTSELQSRFDLVCRLLLEQKTR